MDSKIDLKSMNSEILQSKLLNTLTSNGTITSIKSQLRASLLNILNLPKKQNNISLTHKILNILIAEYFESCNYKCSKSIFIPESNINVYDLNKKDILSYLNISENILNSSLKNDCKLTINLSCLTSALNSRSFNNLAFNKENESINNSSNDPADSILYGLISGISKRDINISTNNTDCQTEWHIKFNASIHYGDWSEDRLVGNGAYTLEKKLELVDQKYDLLNRQNTSCGLTIDDRLAALTKEIEARCLEENRLEMERFKYSEVASIRLEMEADYAKQVQEMRDHLNSQYAARFSALTSRESEFDSNQRRLESDLGRTAFEHRQKITEDLERIRAKEDELRRRRMLDEELLEVEKLKLKDREREVLKMENKINSVLNDHKETYINQINELKFSNQITVEKLQKDSLELKASLEKSNKQYELCSSVLDEKLAIIGENNFKKEQLNSQYDSIYDLNQQLRTELQTLSIEYISTKKQLEESNALRADLESKLKIAQSSVSDANLRASLSLAQTQTAMDRQSLSIEAAALKLKSELDTDYQKQIHILKKEKESEILDIKEAWRKDKLKWSRIMDEENDKQRDLEKELELFRRQVPSIPAFFSPSHTSNNMVNPAKWECYPFDSLVSNKDPIVKKPIINNWIPHPQPVSSILLESKPKIENPSLSNSFEIDYSQSVDRMEVVGKELDALRKHIELKEHMSITNLSLPIPIQTDFNHSNFNLESSIAFESKSAKPSVFTSESESELISASASNNYLEQLRREREALDIAIKQNVEIMAETRSFKNLHNEEIEKKLIEKEITEHMQHLSKLKSTVVLPSHNDMQFKNNFDVEPSAYFSNKESSYIVLKSDTKPIDNAPSKLELALNIPENESPSLSDVKPIFSQIVEIKQDIPPISTTEISIKPKLLPTADIYVSPFKKENMSKIEIDESIQNPNGNDEKRNMELVLSKDIEVWAAPTKVFSPKESHVKRINSKGDITILISSPIASPKAVLKRDDSNKKVDSPPKLPSYQVTKEEIKSSDNSNVLSFDVLDKMAELAETLDKPSKEGPKSVIRSAFNILNKKQETAEEKKTREIRESVEREAIVASTRLKRQQEEDKQIDIAPVQTKPKTVIVRSFQQDSEDEEISHQVVVETVSTNNKIEPISKTDSGLVNLVSNLTDETAYEEEDFEVEYLD